ncbi:hypothetical protein [Streptomyces europaeiscabiei]|uniref:hypothetical protein n=1 Tax=Streptomyces europaeiscabiei TaxID=146819 RepID=UPI002E26CBDC|nr:hypothetical protein OG858_47455 [Streptomyces europaeiscabiei]
MTTNPNPDRDFDGCRRTCRQKGTHTRVWGDCEHGVEPEPTVRLSRVYTEADGFRSIGFDSYTVQQLAELIERGMRGAGVRVSAGRYGDLAHAAAVEIATRHRKTPAPTVPVAAPPTTEQTAEAPAAECSAQHRQFDDGRLCIRAAQHYGDHIDERGFHWSDTVAVYPVSDGTFRRGTDVRAVLRRAVEAEQAGGPSRGATEPQPQLTAEDIARANVLALHQIGEQLAGIESWMWGHLADARDAAKGQAVAAQPAAVDTSEDRCAECGHFRGAHEEADEPVSVGRCTVCADEDERHDFEAAEELRLLAEQPAVGSCVAAETPEPEAGDDPNGALIEDYLRFLRGRGPEPDLSDLPPNRRDAITGQFEIVKALADRDPSLPPLGQDPVARRLGLHAPAAETPHTETPAEAPLLCPRCGTDISEYGEDDFVFRTGDDRPYCSGECIVAAHRTALKTPPAVVAQPGKEPS